MRARSCWCSLAITPAGNITWCSSSPVALSSAQIRSTRSGASTRQARAPAGPSSTMITRDAGAVRCVRRQPELRASPSSDRLSACPGPTLAAGGRPRPGAEVLSRRPGGQHCRARPRRPATGLCANSSRRGSGLQDSTRRDVWPCRSLAGRGQAVRSRRKHVSREQGGDHDDQPRRSAPLRDPATGCVTSQDRRQTGDR